LLGREGPISLWTLADSLSSSQSMGDDRTQSLLQYLPYALKQESIPPLNISGEIVPPRDAGIPESFEKHPKSFALVEFHHRRYLALEELILFKAFLLRRSLMCINCWTTVQASFSFSCRCVILKENPANVGNLL
jgi:hypothetical protein